MRYVLDKLYELSGICAALFICAIVGIVFLQVGFNMTDKIYSYFVGRALGLTIPSYSEFTGFFLAASSFLALAYTLRSGGHIRVSLVIKYLPPAFQHLFEILALLIAMAMTSYASYYICLMIMESIEFGDMTSGMVSLPLWIPQMPVLVGIVVLTIALADELQRTLRGLAPTYHGLGENLLQE